MGSMEFIADLFRISQTEEKLRKDEITATKAAIVAHYKLGKEARGAIEKTAGQCRKIYQHQKKVFNRLKKRSKYLRQLEDFDVH